MLDFKQLILDHSNEHKGYRHPDWQTLVKIVDEKLERDQYDAALTGLAREWLSEIATSLEGDFTLSETPHFLILCNEAEHTRKNLLYHCENALKTIKVQFGESLKSNLVGKQVVIVFNNVHQYYRYTSNFNGSGEQPDSGAMCIKGGYTHIVIPMIYENDSPVGMLAHEITHALLSEYSMPTWLDEALAMRMEDEVVGYDGLMMTKESYANHMAYWNHETIQYFWSGAVWQYESEAFGLSYELARVLWKKIAIDLDATKEELVQFIETLDVKDSGNAAFKKIFEHSLGEMIGDFLGEGDWEPNEEFSKMRDDVLDQIPVWSKSVQELIPLSEEALKPISLQSLEPSSELEQVFSLLGIQTIGDLLAVKPEMFYRYEESIAPVANELYYKLEAIGTHFTYEKVLDAIGNLFFIFREGRIVRGHMDGSSAVMILDVPHLASLIKPGFREFTLTFEQFGGFSFYPHRDFDYADEDLENISLESFCDLDTKISGSELLGPQLSVSCFSANDDESKPVGEFAFYASRAVIHDQEGKEWSIEALEKLEHDYWEGE